MKKALRFLVVILIIATSLLSACKVVEEPADAEPGGVQETTEQDAENSEEEGEVAEVEKVPSRTDLNLTLEAVGGTMDPHAQGLTVDTRVGEQIYEGLLFANEKLQKFRQD